MLYHSKRLAWWIYCGVLIGLVGICFLVFVDFVYIQVKRTRSAIAPVSVEAVQPSPEPSDSVSTEPQSGDDAAGNAQP